MESKTDKDSADHNVCHYRKCKNTCARRCRSFRRLVLNTLKTIAIADDRTKHQVWHNPEPYEVAVVLPMSVLFGVMCAFVGITLFPYFMLGGVVFGGVGVWSIFVVWHVIKDKREEQPVTNKPKNLEDLALFQRPNEKD